MPRFYKLFKHLRGEDTEIDNFFYIHHHQHDNTLIRKHGVKFRIIIDFLLRGNLAPF